MKAPGITESEVVDVLLGAADPVLEARVRRAMAEDPRVADMARQWSETTRIVRRDTASLKAMADRVRSRVMERLPEARRAAALGPADYRPGRGGFWARLLIGVFDGLRARRPLRPVALLALSASLILLMVSMVAFIAFQMGSQYSADPVGLAAGDPPAQSVAGLEDGEAGGGGGALSAGGGDRWRETWLAGFVQGEVVVRVSALESQSMPLAEGQVYHFPATISVPAGAMACLTLADNTGMDITGPSVLDLRHSREVHQVSGEVRYRVPTPLAGGEHFQVLTPHGTVVDLGTEFIVAVHDTNATGLSVLSGRVRALPRLGFSVELTDGMEALLTEDRVATVEPAAGAWSMVTSRLAGPYLRAAPGERIVVPFQPRAGLLRQRSALMDQTPPQHVCLTPRKPRIVSKAPSFTSDSPEMTVIRMQLDGQVVEAALAVDFKLNNTMRIYLDRNLNGDLTDDPVYSEGEDFLAGSFFAVGLGRFDEALWIRRVVTAGGTPDADETQEKIEYINRLYLLSDPILLPDLQGRAAPFRLALLDTASDGDFFNPVGARAVWLADTEADGDDPQIVGGPMRMDGSGEFQGFRWSLEEDAAGQRMLVAEKVAAALPISSE